MSGHSEIRRSVYLNGRWADPHSPLSVHDPATGELLARVGTVDRAAVKQAIADTAASWLSWRQLSPKDRGEPKRKRRNGGVAC